MFSTWTTNPTIIMILATLAIGPAGAATITINASADAYIRAGNQNFGTETFLRIRETGNHRSLVRFSDSDIATAVGSGVLQSATLELFIENNGGGWSGSGRSVDIHALLEDWSESGVTFNCPDDTDVSNGAADCAEQWAGGSFNGTASASYIQTNSLTGAIQLDVTSDVASFISGTDNYGWLIKKREENQNGLVDHTSREGAATQQPKLILDVFVPPTDTPTSTPTLTPTPTETPTATRTDTPSPTATPDPNCGAAPIVGCKQSIAGNKSLLLLKDKGGAKDKLVFKWIKGDTTEVSDFGDPTSDTSYALCLYDETGGSSSLIFQALVPPAGSCSGKACWRPTSKGFRYKDSLVLNDGIKLITLKSGPSGKAKIVVKGQGSPLNLPTLPLTQDRRVIAQLESTGGAGECWEARFSAPPKKNTAELFKDKGDPPITFAPTDTPTKAPTSPTSTPTPAAPTDTPSPTSTPTATPTGPTATPTATDTPGGANCGNGFLEPGEFFADPNVGDVGDTTGIECPEDAQILACSPLGALHVEVYLVPPIATQPTSATVLIGYRSDLASLPAAAGGSAAANVTWATPLPFIRNATDFDYAVRVITVRTDGPFETGEPIFSVDFDTCAGQPAPDPASDFGCIVEGCSGAGGPISGCICTID